MKYGREEMGHCCWHVRQIHEYACLLSVLVLGACSAAGSATSQPTSVQSAATRPLAVNATGTTAASTVVLITPASTAETSAATTTRMATGEATISGVTATVEPSAALVSTPTATPVPAPLIKPSVGLKLIAQGLVGPVALVAVPDGSRRLFVVDQIGLIRIIDAGGTLLPEPFLDLRDRMVGLNAGYDERGLLGLALDPHYALNGRFYVYYSAPSRQTGIDHIDRIARYNVSTQDPNRGDPNSEQVILEADHPGATHNGGSLAFGPDGYLYISLGDGGGPGFISSNAQDLSTLLGKILRIDVGQGSPYSIPSDNPFMGEGQRHEIYAIGFRNPYRMAFDAGGGADSHSLYVEDAGEDLWEEVDVVIKGGNYGWPIREGITCFNRNNSMHPLATCADTAADGSPLINPIVVYPNIKIPGGIGMVGVGGDVYRGRAMPTMQGRYIFGDWGTNYSTPDGTLLVASPPQHIGQMWTLQKLTIATSANGRVNQFVRGFGVDLNGEMYVLTSGRAGPAGNTGRVYRIVPAG